MSGNLGPSPPATGAEGLLDLALSQPHQALATARALLSGTVAPGVAAVAHQAAAVVLREFGDIDQSLVEFRRAIGCARRAADHERAADARAAYGVALLMAGRPRAGLAQIEAAARGAVGPAAGRIHIRRAHAFYVLGRYPQMLGAAQAAISALATVDDPNWQARAYGHRAVANLFLGNVSRVDGDYARAEALLARTGQRLEYASALHDRGAAAFARGDLPAALALLDDAQQVVDELGVSEPEIDVTRVEVLLAAQLHRDALQVADGAVRRIEHSRGSATDRAVLLFAAARAAAASGDPALAVVRGAEALRMFRRQHQTVWAARAELALLESRYATGDRSPPLLRAAARLAARLPERDRARARDGHLLAGRVALALGRGAAADRHLRAAAAGRPVDLRGRTTGWLARALLADVTGRPRDMIVACSRGLDGLEAHLATLGATELRAEATVQGGELARLVLRSAVADGDARRLFTWSERWRATALAVPPVRSDADAAMTRALTTLRALTRRSDPAGTARGADLALDRRRAEDAVRKESLRSHAGGQARARRVRLRDLRPLLEDTDLLQLTDVGGQLFAVVLATDRAPVMRLVGSTAMAERSLAHALFALRRAAARRAQVPLDMGAIGTRLQDTLLGPAARLLTSAEVVLVPPGRLHAVPWGLLPALRDRPFTVAPSAATWVRGRQAAVRPADGGERVVLVAGPGLATGTTEVRRLAERYPHAVVLADGEATCERALTAMDGAWLGHVAAHGIFRADSPLLSALELDDGPLTVYDLERLARAPHRVVLSSCNSAVGAPTGADELLGVVSALVALGSAGVVASVVPVDDPGTVAFMLALHEFLPGRSLGEALLRARRSLPGDRTASWVGESFIALGG